MSGLAFATVRGPTIAWAAVSPLIALAVGACIVLMAGLFQKPLARHTIVPTLSIATFLTTIGLSIWQWPTHKSAIAGALAIDDLTLALTFIFCAAGGACVMLSTRGLAPREVGTGEHHALLITTVLGMVVLAGSENLVTVFVGYELLSIPLYVLCASSLRRETSLESGLKYLIIGSVGSATLLYGLAFIYGATGSTDFTTIAAKLPAVRGDVLLLTGLAFTVVGLAFKASVAPFHQWTPDVYEGAPTPITAFMAVATKAAALGVFLRLFDVGLIGSWHDWAPAVAALAAVTILVGNVGAIGQSSLKRMLAYSSVAQAGYMLAGVVVATQLGISATVFYLAAYVVMNLAAFAVVIIRERESVHGDDIQALSGLGSERPWLAWPMTIAMLALAGFPATIGFFGKLYLIDAAVDNGYAWLGVVIVVGSAISLAYYLRVIAAVWMQEPITVSLGSAIKVLRPQLAGASITESRERAIRTPDISVQTVSDTKDSLELPSRGEKIVADSSTNPHQLAIVVGVASATATVFFGIYPGPLFSFAERAGAALTSLL